MQHMVRAVVFTPALDAYHIARLGYDADQRFVPPITFADGAHVAVRQILADLTAVDVGLSLADRVGKGFCLFIRLGEQIKRKPLRAFLSDPGKRGKLIDQIL